MGSDLRRWEAADREALERALAEVEAERDRLRRELEALRDECRDDVPALRMRCDDDGGGLAADRVEEIADRIDAILTGEGEQ